MRQLLSLNIEPREFSAQVGEAQALVVVEAAAEAELSSS